MIKHLKGKRTVPVRAIALTAAFAVSLSTGLAGTIASAAPSDFTPRTDFSFRDPGTDTGERIETILAQLTLEEKIALATSSPTPGAIQRLGLGASRGGATEAVHGLNSGTSTVFPVPLGFSQSWDKELLNSIGDTIATEGTASGSYSWWSPVMDLARDPRAGRNYELLGEDAYLVGQLGTEMASGMNARTSEDGYFQGIPLLKHAIGYNVEVNRLWLNSSLPERAKNEYYIKAFKYPIASGNAKAFMNSYPLINGKPMSVNPIQNDALTKWTPDYTGTGHSEYATVNDYGSGSSMWVHSQRYFPDTPAGRALGIGESLRNGQMSWSFRDYGSTSPLIYDALARGIIDESDIEANARRSLSLGLRFGTYDQTEIKNPYILNPAGDKAALVAEHREDTLKSSQEQIVLLKNEGNTLPLKSAQVNETVLVGGLAEEIGHNNYTPRAPYVISIKDALANKLGADKVHYDRAVDTVAFQADNGKYLEAVDTNVYSGPGASTSLNVPVKAIGSPTGALPAKTDAEKGMLFQWYDYGTINHLLRSNANDLFLQVPHTSSSGGAMAGQLVNNTFAPGQGNSPSGFSYVAYQHFRIVDTDDGKVGLYNLIAGDGGNNPYAETAMAYDQDDEDTNNGSYLYADTAGATPSDIIKADASDGKVGPAINETHTDGPSLLNEAPWDVPIAGAATDNRTVDALPTNYKFDLKVVESSTEAIAAQVAAAPANAPILLVVGNDEWLNAREAIDLQETGLSPQQIRNIEYITGEDSNGDGSVVSGALNRDVILIIKTSSPMTIDQYVHNNSKVKAIVEIGNSGQEEGPAIVSALFDDGYSIKDAANFAPKTNYYTKENYATYPGYLNAENKIPFEAPAGRLSTTWYSAVTDMVGASEDHPPSSFRWPAYSETDNDQFSNLNGTVPQGLNQYDIVKGERTYQYLNTAAHPPLYPFGYGLTYSSFTYSDVSASVVANGKFTVTGKVRNAGTITSDEVVQLYSKFTGTPSRIQQPNAKLIGFERIQDIAPGATKDFSFTVDLVDNLGVWDVEISDYIVEPGTYDISVSHSALDTNATTVPVTVSTANGGKAVATRNLGKAFTLAESFDDYSNVSGDLEDVELVTSTKELYSNTAVSLRANGAWLAYKGVQLQNNGTLSVKIGADRTGAVEVHAVPTGAPAPSLGDSTRIATVPLTDTRPLDPTWDSSSTHTGTGLGIGPVVVRNETTFNNRQYPNSPKGKIATENDFDGANAYVAPVLEVKTANVTASAGTYDVYLLTQNRGTKVEWLKVAAAADDATSVEVKSPSGEYSIQEPEGYLDLDVNLAPVTAASNVVWSVALPDGVSGNVNDIATIDAQGVLQAAGIANGKVVVTATANGKQGKLEVLVTNQLAANKVTIGGALRSVTYPILVTGTAVGGADIITAFKGTLTQSMRFSGVFEEDPNKYYLPGTQQAVPASEVAWSVTDQAGNGTYLATVNSAGVVSATGYGDGKVNVVGTLIKNPDITATRTITITGQKTARSAFAWIQAEVYGSTDARAPGCTGAQFWGMCFGTWGLVAAAATDTWQTGGNEVGSAMQLSAGSTTSYQNIDFGNYELDKLGVRLAPYPGFTEPPGFGGPPPASPLTVPSSTGQPYTIDFWIDGPDAATGGTKIVSASGTFGTSVATYETAVVDVAAKVTGVHDLFIRTNAAANVNWFQFTTKSVVKDRLQTAVTIAGAKEQGTASAADWAALQNALTEARAVLAKADADQGAIDAAVFALEGALAKFPGPSAELSGLAAVANALKGLNSADYTPESWISIQTGLNVAQALLTPGANPSDAAVQSLIDELSEALANLKPKEVVSPTPPPTTAPTQTEKDSLQEVLPHLQASIGDQGQYTAESWAAYVTALAAANSVLTDVNATPAQVQEATKQLLAASVQLIKTTPIVAEPPVKVTTKSVKVTGKAFKKNTKPKVSVTIKLSTGTPKGKVTLTIGKTKQTVKVSKTTTKITLKKKFSKAIKVKAKYVPTKAANGTTRTATKTIKVKK